MKKRILGQLKKIKKLVSKPEMTVLPGNLAFNFVLSLIPTIMIIIFIASLFNVSVDLIIDLIQKFIPADVSKTIVEVISGKGFDTSVGIFLIIAIVVASNGMYSIVNVSDVMYQIKGEKELVKRLKSLLLLFILVLLFLFLLLVPVFGNQILLLLKNNNFLSFIIDEIIQVFNIIKWPMTFLIIFYNIKLVYTISPSKTLQIKDTNLGAFITTILWIISTIIFGYYLKYFARYDILYGNLSSIIVLMIWMYLLAYIFTLGICINVTRYNKDKTD